MQIARGLMRVWVVLSALWLAGVAFIAWRYDGIAASEPPGILTLCPDDPSGVFEKYVTGCVKPGEYLAERAAGRRSGQKAAAERRSNSNLLACLPPTFMLALAWVFRGLR